MAIRPLQTRGTFQEILFVSQRDIVATHDRAAIVRYLKRCLADPGQGSRLRHAAGELGAPPSADDEAIVELFADALQRGSVVAIRTGPSFLPLDPPRSVRLADLAKPVPEPAAAPAETLTFVSVVVVDQYGEPLAGTCTIDADNEITDDCGPDDAGSTRIRPGGMAHVSVEGLRQPGIAVPSAIHPRVTDLQVQRFPYGEPLTIDLAIGAEHTVVVECPHVVRVETDALRFAEGSCIPVPRDGEHDPIAALATVLAWLHERPDRSLLVVGHASTLGSESSNEALAQDRADAMAALVRRDRDAWVDLATNKGSPADVQFLLTHCAEARAWPTDPGRTDGVVDGAYHDAARRFQARYNLEYGTHLTEDGVVGQQTLGALFDMQLAISITSCWRSASPGSHHRCSAPACCRPVRGWPGTPSCPTRPTRRASAGSI